MCHVHLTRQALKKVPKKKQKEVADKIKEAVVDRQKYNDLIKELDSMGYKGAADTLERFQYEVMNYMQFPEKHWKKIRTTNMMESQFYRKLGTLPLPNKSKIDALWDRFWSGELSNPLESIEQMSYLIFHEKS